MKITQSSDKLARYYAIAGALFGFVFPLTAYILVAAGTGRSVLTVFLARDNQALFITELGPLVLGCFAYAIGKREQRIRFLSDERVRERLEAAELVGRYGSWEIDLATLEVAWSKGLFSLYGIEGSRYPTYAEFLEIVHPDDREAVNLNLAAIQTGTSGTYEIFVRIIKKDSKEIRHHRSVGSIVIDPTTGTKRLIGTSHDLTEVVEARNQALTVMKEKSELEAIHAMIVTYKHEINNPLAIALGSLETMDPELAANPSVARTQSALLRIADILRRADALTFTKRVQFESYANSGTKMVSLAKTDVQTPKPR
jgi:signal transduction histidine kinase